MAWLTTDNVLVALSRSHSPSVLSGVRLVAIDALHSPVTLGCAEQVQQKCGKQVLWRLPSARGRSSSRRTAIVRTWTPLTLNNYLGKLALLKVSCTAGVPSR